MIEYSAYNNHELAACVAYCYAVRPDEGSWLIPRFTDFKTRTYEFLEASCVHLPKHCCCVIPTQIVYVFVGYGSSTQVYRIKVS